MKKKFLTILTAVIMAAVLAACGTRNPDPQPTEGASVSDAAENETEGQDTVSHAVPFSGDSGTGAVSVSLPEPLKAAVCDYLMDNARETDRSQKVLIPGYIAVDADTADPEDVRVMGDFWYMAYDWQGDTLISGQGREFSGVLHFQEEDGQYSFVRKEEVTASAGTDAAEKLFQNSYPAWEKIRSDYKRREETRAQLIADYAAAFGLAASRYHDYGWDPDDLPDPAPDIDNVFYYMLHRGDMVNVSDVVVSPAAEEVRKEEAYVVKRGDTLGKIAAAYGVSTTELAERNRDTIIRAARSQGITSEDLMHCANYIFPGEILAVPVG